MRPSQSETSTNTTQGNQTWVHVKFEPANENWETITMPPSPTQQEWIDANEAADRVRREATATSPGYPGPTEAELQARLEEAKQNAEHSALSWTVCYDDQCLVHISEKQGKNWFPQRTTKSPRRPHAETNWIHCFRDNCRVHKRTKIEAGYYPRQDGQNEPLNKKDAATGKRRATVRTRLERERGENSEGTPTDPDEECLKRQVGGLNQEVADLREALYQAEKTIAEGLDKIDRQQRTIETANDMMESMRQTYRKEREEFARMRKVMRRMGREILSLGSGRE